MTQGRRYRSPSPRTRERISRLSGDALDRADAAGQALRMTLLDGARIAVIGAGYERKRPIYERARALGAELVMVDVPGRWSESLVNEGVARALVPMPESTLARGADPGAVLDALGAEGSALDGVCTFWEDCLPLCARVSDQLGLPGNPVNAIDRARSKLQTRECLTDAGMPVPRFARIAGVGDLEDAAEHVGFPAILKPEYGAAAVGCFRVDSKDALGSAYARIAPLIHPDVDPIFFQGTDMLLEEYLVGVEFDVDLVLRDGSCVYAATAENWPTHEPTFVETGLHMPSTQPPAVVAAVEQAATQAARSLGLTTGVLHVEVRNTPAGPRILEVNARMGGGMIHAYHLAVHGVDPAVEHLLAAIGSPVNPPRADRPRCGVAEAVLQSDRSGTIRTTSALTGLAEHPDIAGAVVFVEPGDPVICAADGFPTVLAEIYLTAADVTVALTQLRRLTGDLRLDIVPAG